MKKDNLLASYAKGTVSEKAIRNFTICVNGIVLSGELCSPKEFFENALYLKNSDNLTNLMERSDPGELKEYLTFIDETTQKYQETKVEDIEYIYLKDVFIINPPGNAHIKDLVLRIRLDSVDAFGFGTISYS